MGGVGEEEDYGIEEGVSYFYASVAVNVTKDRG